MLHGLKPAHDPHRTFSLLCLCLHRRFDADNEANEVERCRG